MIIRDPGDGVAALAAALLCALGAYLALVLRANGARHRWYFVPLVVLPVLAFVIVYLLALVWS